MNKNIQTRLLIISTGFFLVASVSVEAGILDHRFDLARKVNKEDMTEVYKQLNLTEQQKGSLENNRNKHRSNVKELRAQIKQLRKQLKEEIGKPDMDEGRVRSLKSELNKKQSKLTDLRVEGIIGIREILTPQQYDLFYQKTH